jgi:LysR family transcriptional regulator for bpeEF and oprC
LRVDVATGVANDIIIPALPQFFARYPDIALELGCGDRAVDLIEEGIDCAVRGGALPDSSLIARRIGVLHFVTCASPAYLAEHGRPDHPNDLQKHRCVNYFSSKTGKIYDWDFARGDEQIQVAMPSCLAVNDSTAYISAGLAGLGVMQMPSYTIDTHIASGALELLLEDWHSAPLPVNVVYPQNRHLSAKVRVFVEWVADLFMTHPGFQIKASQRHPASEKA